MRKPIQVNPSPLEQMQSGLRIDRNRLEECCQGQPDLFFKVSEEAAYAVSERDAAKTTLAQVKAEADPRARDAIDGAGDKVTESRVEHWIALDNKVQIAEANLRDLNLKVGLIYALKEAYEQRRSMLEQLVKLYLNNYYGADIGANAARDISADNNRREISKLDREARGDRARHKERVRS